MRRNTEVLIEHGLTLGATVGVPLVGVLAAILVVSGWTASPEDPRDARARAKLERLENAVRAYVGDHGRPPADLTVLTRPEPRRGGTPYARAADLVDPWGQAYVLRPGVDGAPTVNLRRAVHKE